MNDFEPEDDKVRIPVNVEWKKEPEENLNVRRLIMLLDHGSLIDHNLDRAYRCGDPSCNVVHKGLKALLIHAVVSHNTPPTEPVAIKIPYPNKQERLPKTLWEKLREFKDGQGD